MTCSSIRAVVWPPNEVRGTNKKATDAHYIYTDSSFHVFMAVGWCASVLSECVYIYRIAGNVCSNYNYTAICSEK